MIVGRKNNQIKQTNKVKKKRFFYYKIRIEVCTCSEKELPRFFLLFPFPSLFLTLAWETGNTETALPVEQSRVGMGTVSLFEI